MTILAHFSFHHWKIRNGNNSLFALIASENPLTVQYFELSVKGEYYILNDTIFDEYVENLDQKIDKPEIIRKGKRVFYYFE